MTQEQLIAARLASALKECRQHRLRLHSAWKEAQQFAALKERSTVELSEEQIKTLDQLLFRFGKLQDALGLRLLPATLAAVQEWRDNAPFLDQLNRAEKLGMLLSLEQWQLLRELRNQSAHEYPDQPELVRTNLRLLVAHVPLLEKMHQRLLDWIGERGLAQIRP